MVDRFNTLHKRIRFRRLSLFESGNLYLRFVLLPTRRYRKTPRKWTSIKNKRCTKGESLRYALTRCAKAENKTRKRKQKWWQGNIGARHLKAKYCFSVAWYCPSFENKWRRFRLSKTLFLLNYSFSFLKTIQKTVKFVRWLVYRLTQGSDLPATRS